MTCAALCARLASSSARKTGHMKYRTVSVYPQVDQQLNKAIELVATKQAGEAGACSRRRRPSIAELKRAGVCARSGRGHDGLSPRPCRRVPLRQPRTVGARAAACLPAWGWLPSLAVLLAITLVPAAALLVASLTPLSLVDPAGTASASTIRWSTTATCWRTSASCDCIGTQLKLSVVERGAAGRPGPGHCAAPARTLAHPRATRAAFSSRWCCRPSWWR